MSAAKFLEDMRKILQTHRSSVVVTRSDAFRLQSLVTSFEILLKTLNRIDRDTSEEKIRITIQETRALLSEMLND
jgi:flagellar biosynthesis/type III secretory pathway chaperone